MFSQLDDNIVKSQFFCIICPIARQTRLVFLTSSVKTNIPFQLLHVDVWGPLRHQSRIKCNIFISIVVEFSKFTWIHFVICKSDYVSVLRNFISFVEKQFNLTVKCIRSDNALKLIEGAAK